MCVERPFGLCLPDDQSWITRVERRFGFSVRERTGILRISVAELDDIAQKAMAKTSAVARMIMNGPR